MAFELRALKATDLFSLAKIIGKIGLREFGELFKEANIGQDLVEGNEESIGMEIGFAFAGILAENLEVCEDDLFKFLGNLTNEKPQTIKDCSPADFIDLIIAVVQLQDFKDFLQRASQFAK